MHCSLAHGFAHVARVVLVAGCLLAAGHAVSAQTAAPVPAPIVSDETGLFPRAALFVSLAGMQTSDPQFSWVERSRGDLDLVGYRHGRVNFLIDTELVMGSERRSFDLNQANIIFELSGSWRAGAVEIAGVAHHVSKHVVDREFDRVPAWDTVGARATYAVATPASQASVTLDYGRIVQHTFVDYAWTSQLTARFEGAIAGRARAFLFGSGGLIGVDGTLPGRDTQKGGRIEGGVRVSPARGAAEVYAALEHRVDAYPTSRLPTSWFELGVRLGTP